MPCCATKRVLAMCSSLVWCRFARHEAEGLQDFGFGLWLLGWLWSFGGVEASSEPLVRCFHRFHTLKNLLKAQFMAMDLLQKRQNDGIVTCNTCGFPVKKHWISLARALFYSTWSGALPASPVTLAVEARPLP